MVVYSEEASCETRLQETESSLGNDSGLRLVAGTKNTQLGMAKDWLWEHIYKVNYCICSKKNTVGCS